MEDRELSSSKELKGILPLAINSGPRPCPEWRLKSPSIMLYCAVSTCMNKEWKKNDGKNIKFHCFPWKNAELTERWKRICKRKDDFNAKTSRICSEHFNPEDYVRDLMGELLGLELKMKLKEDAIPTLFVPGYKPLTEAQVKRQIRLKEREEKRYRKELVEEILGTDTLDTSLENHDQCDETEVIVKVEPPEDAQMVDLCQLCNVYYYINDQRQDQIDSSTNTLKDFLNLKVCKTSSPEMNKIQKDLLKELNFEINEHGLPFCDGCLTRIQQLHQLYLKLQQIRDDFWTLNTDILRKLMVACSNRLGQSYTEKDLEFSPSAGFSLPGLEYFRKELHPCQVKLHRIDELHTSSHGSQGQLLGYPTASTAPDNGKTKANHSHPAPERTHIFEFEPTPVEIEAMAIKIDCTKMFQLINQYSSNKTEDIEIEIAVPEDATEKTLAREAREATTVTNPPNADGDCIEPFVCEICSKDLTTYNRFRRHQLTHKRDKRYSCVHCHKRFLEEDGLTKHMQSHSNNMRLTCDFCEVRFSQPLDLKRHLLKIHNQIKNPFLCDLCPNLKFRYLNQLRKHKVQIHHQASEVPQNSWRWKRRCEHCDFIGENLLSYRNHLAKEHSSQNLKSKVKSHLCETCGRSFSNSSGLRLHVNHVHKNLSPHVCTKDDCNRRFISRTALKRHVLIEHMGSKWLPCAYCEQRFGSSNGCRKHMAKAHAEQYLHNKQHVCSFCWKCFESELQLNTHKDSVHTKCQVCQKMFLNGPRLRRHERVHIPGERFQCPHCRSICNHLDSFKLHLRRHAGITAKPCMCSICGVRYLSMKGLSRHMKEKHQNSTTNAINNKLG